MNINQHFFILSFHIQSNIYRPYFSLLSNFNVKYFLIRKTKINSFIDIITSRSIHSFILSFLNLEYLLSSHRVLNLGLATGNMGIKGPVSVLKKFIFWWGIDESNCLHSRATFAMEVSIAHCVSPAR